MATIHRFTQSELAPCYVFDSSFLVTLIIESQRWHTEARDFFERLVREQQGRAFIVSPLAFAEFSKGVIRAVLIASHGMTREQAEAEIQERGAERARAELSDALSRLYSALDFLPWNEVPFDFDHWYRVSSVLMTSPLQPYDAVHAAAAFHADCRDIVTFDYGFDRLQDISVWRVK